ncbi:hypothetical protein RSOLAG22IIIB_09182 [Rhizoctonia solani]|uniref:Uncharacterized protein n=1 Tax=Rhizoctonia solani TaxID=456999 RepID=A0A0K6FXD0_9AGAM|nr:hypothetical protein RSOLAG22IIIB_09182 [Rhizoctonia solani]
MVKRIEGILEDSMRVFEGHERVMASGGSAFSVLNTASKLPLALKVVEVKQEIHLQQHQDTSFSTAEGRGSDRIVRDVVRLQNHAEIFHQDLLTANRRAQLNEKDRFLGRHKEEYQTPEVDYHYTPNRYLTSSQLADPTTWYSVVSSKPSTESLATSDTAILEVFLFLADEHRYMAVAYISSVKPGSETPEGDDSVRQILILESNNKTVIVFDPNRHALNDTPNVLNGFGAPTVVTLGRKNSLLEMSRAGEALLRITDPKNLQGYKVVDNPPHETSWVDSFVHGLARLGVGVGADMM